jgi:hypothetical protein
MRHCVAESPPAASKPSPACVILDGFPRSREGEIRGARDTSMGSLSFSTHPPHMPRRPLTAKELVAGVAIAALAGLAWKATEAAAGPSTELEPLPVTREPTAPPDVSRATRRRLPAVRLAAAAAVAALIVSGMAFSAGPNERLEAARPAAPAFHPSPASRVLLLPVASRHLHDPSTPASVPPKAAPRTSPDERTAALAEYVDALGPDTMLAGLGAERSVLAQRVLADPRVHVYPGGRNDLASGKVDPRIDAVLEYLADAYGEVTVSCLVSGHSHFVHQTKREKKLKLPQVVSAHVYGRAVDISAVAGIPIAGNQQPGGISERTIRRILALPDWLRPKQVISLLELGGPSFALPDHADHIHVGY